MAVANEQLRVVAENLNQQQEVNTHIETRMKLREIEAVQTFARIESVKSAADLKAAEQDGKIKVIEDWKRTINGVMISIVTALLIMAAVAIGYAVFGVKP